MAYASASDVGLYTPGLLDDGNFTLSTTPTKAAVERFLSAGCALIETRLKAAGYSVPVGGGAAVYDQISDLNALYAAGRAEMVRMTARVSATERSRSQMFMDAFNNGIDVLLSSDLSRAGLSVAQKSVYVGGISSSDKDAVENDTDRIAPRFSRGQFRHTDTQRPSQSSNDDETSE